MQLSPIRLVASRLGSLSLLDAIIVASICWTTFQFTHPNWRLPKQVRPAAPPIALNQTLALPGVDWSKHTTTVALAFTQSCHYCQASGDFYAALSAEIANHPGLSLLVISPDPGTSLSEWMHGHKVLAFEHLNVNFALYGFRVTPTIALIDSTGRVTDVVVGKVSPAEQAQVIARLEHKLEVPLVIRASQSTQAGTQQ